MKRLLLVALLCSPAAAQDQTSCHGLKLNWAKPPADGAPGVFELWGDFGARENRRVVAAGQAAYDAEILSWTSTVVRARLPPEAPDGRYELSVSCTHRAGRRMVTERTSAQALELQGSGSGGAAPTAAERKLKHLEYLRGQADKARGSPELEAHLRLKEGLEAEKQERDAEAFEALGASARLFHGEIVAATPQRRHALEEEYGRVVAAVARLALRRGDPAAAEAIYQERLDLYKDAADQQRLGLRRDDGLMVQAETTRELARLALAAGRRGQALERFSAAAALYRRSSDPGAAGLARACESEGAAAAGAP